MRGWPDDSMVPSLPLDGGGVAEAGHYIRGCMRAPSPCSLRSSTPPTAAPNAAPSALTLTHIAA